MSKCEKCGSEYQAQSDYGPLARIKVEPNGEWHSPDRCIAALQARVAALEVENDAARQLIQAMETHGTAGVKMIASLQAQLQAAQETLHETHETYCNGLECPICAWEKSALGTHSGSGG